ncbi:MAG: MmcQ/YjbR family DNA-binding protein [Ferruginibacter sp.]
MVTVETFRQMALALPDAIELPHFDRTSFRVNKRIFATLDEQKKIAVLMFSPLEQSVFCAFDKNIIYPVPGGWGKQGATIFELSKIKKAMLKDALQVVFTEVLNKKRNKN